MAEMVVRLEWDEEDLGPMWMNIDNLELLLHSKRYSTRRDLLRAEEISHSEKDKKDKQ